MTLLDVFREPAIGDDLVDRMIAETRHDAMDAGPRRAAVSTRTDDVEQAREFPADPRAAVVLVGDRVDAQFCNRFRRRIRARAREIIEGMLGEPESD